MIGELTEGGFQPVIGDSRIEDRAKVTRIVLCSGKVFYDLEAARGETIDGQTAVVRLEQFYPFPVSRLKEVIASYPNTKEIFWTQEEPRNMGGWTFIRSRLEELKPEKATLRYVGRVASASPATGSYAIHELEQKRIVDEALGNEGDEISNASETEVSEKLAPATA
jgi:2-oxoglutarate dehydrogenase E1 component